jgi:hypothetical protein
MPEEINLSRNQLPQNRPELGQSVIARSEMKKRRKYTSPPLQNAVDNYGRNYDVVWDSVPLKQPVQGVYIGWRRKFEGKVLYDWDGRYSERQFIPLRSVIVFLVIENERKNPIEVDPYSINL